MTESSFPLLPDRSELYVLRFEPHYVPRVWGGHKIAALPERENAPADAAIGEAWELSDREDVQSVVRNGALKGRKLRELVENYRNDLVGDAYDGGAFPLLVKIIDAKTRLSLQVHPDEAACAQFEPVGAAQPKTEMWYVLGADRNAKIMAGLSPSTSQHRFIEEMATPEVEKSLQIFESAVGDAYFIRAGRVHAIGGGNLIFEVQQNSDTTFRLSDWGRLGSDGKPRQLHVEEGLACINFVDRTSPRIPAAVVNTAMNRKVPVIVNCPFFTVHVLHLRTSWSDTTFSNGSFHLLTPLNGTIRVVISETVQTTVPPYASTLVPACIGAYTIEPEGSEFVSVLRTTL